METPKLGIIAHCGNYYPLCGVVKGEIVVALREADPHAVKPILTP